MSLRANTPVALFDSGIGGLSVLRHVRAQLPDEDLIYVADSAHTPYGEKGDEFIVERSMAIGRYLVTQGAKAIVVACNTATAAAIHEMRAGFALPIVGVEPGVKPAVAQSRNGKVGVLATSATLASRKFRRLLDQHKDGAELHLQACPGLVELVEEGRIDLEQSGELLQRYLKPLLAERIDTLALGCTHYLFLLPAIRELVGEEIGIIDTGPAVTRQLIRQLERKSIPGAGAQGTGSLRIVATHVSPMLTRRVCDLLGENVEVEALM